VKAGEPFVRDEQNKKGTLLGLGLDNADGEARITHGRNFHLVGGSHDTHARMQEKCIKFNEKLDIHGKQLEDLEHQEFLDIADECGMPLLTRRSKNN
jgi:hypothetical protein